MQHWCNMIKLPCSSHDTRCCILDSVGVLSVDRHWSHIADCYSNQDGCWWTRVPVSLWPPKSVKIWPSVTGIGGIGTTGVTLRRGQPWWAGRRCWRQGRSLRMKAWQGQTTVGAQWWSAWQTVVMSRATPAVSCRHSFSVCCFSSRHQRVQCRRRSAELTLTRMGLEQWYTPECRHWCTPAYRRCTSVQQVRHPRWSPLNAAYHSEKVPCRNFSVSFREYRLSFTLREWR